MIYKCSTHKILFLPFFFMLTPHNNSTLYHNYESHIKANQANSKLKITMHKTMFLKNQWYEMKENYNKEYKKHY